jgi:hypothetical protein
MLVSVLLLYVMVPCSITITPPILFKNGNSTFVSMMTSHLKTEVDRIPETSCVSLLDILRTVDSVQLIVSRGNISETRRKTEVPPVFPLRVC